MNQTDMPMTYDVVNLVANNSGINFGYQSPSNLGFTPETRRQGLRCPSLTRQGATPITTCTSIGAPNNSNTNNSNNNNGGSSNTSTAKAVSGVSSANVVLVNGDNAPSNTANISVTAPDVVLVLTSANAVTWNIVSGATNIKAILKAGSTSSTITGYGSSSGQKVEQLRTDGTNVGNITNTSDSPYWDMQTALQEMTDLTSTSVKESYFGAALANLTIKPFITGLFNSQLIYRGVGSLSAGSNVTVNISGLSGPVNLVLASADAINWTINPGSATITTVVLSNEAGETSTVVSGVSQDVVRNVEWGYETSSGSGTYATHIAMVKSRLTYNSQKPFSFIGTASQGNTMNVIATEWNQDCLSEVAANIDIDDSGSQSANTTVCRINTPTQWMSFARNCNTGTGSSMNSCYANLLVTANLNFATLDGTTEDATSGNSRLDIRNSLHWATGLYYGAFNGQNFVFSGVDIDICDNTNWGESGVGGLFGKVGAPSQTSNNSIKNVRFSGTQVSGCKHVGGIVGLARGARLENVINTAEVKRLQAPDANNKFVGGIVGYFASGDRQSYIKNATNFGNISCLNCYRVGGIVGYSQMLANDYMENLTNAGGMNIPANSTSVVTTGDSVGGIAGLLNGGTLRYARNFGPVWGNAYVAGIAAELSSGIIEKSFNIGEVSASRNSLSYYSHAGGLVASANGGQINLSYNLGLVAAGKSVAGGIVAQAGKNNAPQATTITQVYNAGKILMASAIDTQSEVDTDYFGCIVGYKWNAGSFPNEVPTFTEAVSFKPATGAYGGLFTTTDLTDPSVWGTATLQASLVDATTAGITHNTTAGTGTGGFGATTVFTNYATNWEVTGSGDNARPKILNLSETQPSNPNSD